MNRQGTRKMIVPCIIAVIALTLTIGCSDKTRDIPDLDKEKQFGIYRNELVGFTFEFPLSWNSSAKTHPDKWAITDEKKNAILFMAASLPQGKSILDEFLEQARADLQQPNVPANYLKDAIGTLESQNYTWYTYAISYKDKNLESINSAVSCKGNIINVILVSSSEDFEALKPVYTRILESFVCEG